MGAPKKVFTETDASGVRRPGEAPAPPGQEPPPGQGPIVLSERDFKLIMDAGENPPELSGKMKKAWRDYQEAVESGRIVAEGLE